MISIDGNEIVVPEPRPVPAAVDVAHTCEGWIEIPKGSRPRCQRCDERRERYQHVAAGNGTVAEIREAISALEHVRGQTPLGETVRATLAGMRVWACPRSVTVGEGVMVDEVPNRRARRRLEQAARKRAKRR